MIIAHLNNKLFSSNYFNKPTIERHIAVNQNSTLTPLPEVYMKNRDALRMSLTSQKYTFFR